MSKVVIRVCVIRLKRYGYLELALRVFPLPELVINSPQIEVSLRITRVKSNSLLVGKNGKLFRLLPKPNEASVNGRKVCPVGDRLRCNLCGSTGRVDGLLSEGVDRVDIFCA